MPCCRLTLLFLPLAAAASCAFACDTRETLPAGAGPEPSAPPEGGTDAPTAPSTEVPVAVASASLQIDVSEERATVGPYAFGMHTSVYDNQLHHPAVPELLSDAGIRLLRYPGGGYADNYHWSNHSMTAWFDTTDRGYLAPGSDFGSYVSLLESSSAAVMITVNYGSNLSGTGPGEPKEAAAWVAYCNGDPSDETLIGEDASGEDWSSVGYWANLRASQPVTPDDGLNHLRINRGEPLAVEYWEIGNEVFGNGYYEAQYEQDLHVPYDGTPRLGHADLSPSSYGRGVVEYALAMKAVDPSIKIGAVLNTPPNDYDWGPSWNADVLRECGTTIDFAIVHLYQGNRAQSLLRVPTRRIGAMVQELRTSIADHCGDNAANVELTMTEIGPGLGFENPATAAVTAIYAADVYATLIEHQFTNIDWLEMHNGTFLVEATQAQGPAYHGIRMASLLATPGDQLVTVQASNTLDPETNEMFAGHASVRQDGSVGIMLVNRAPLTRFDASVALTGMDVAAQGSSYQLLAEGSDPVMQGPMAMDGLGGQFSLELPPYSVTLLSLQPAP